MSSACKVRRFVTVLFFHLYANENYRVRHLIYIKLYSPQNRLEGDSLGYFHFNTRTNTDLKIVNNKCNKFYEKHY